MCTTFDCLPACILRHVEVFIVRKVRLHTFRRLTARTANNCQKKNRGKEKITTTNLTSKNMRLEKKSSTTIGIVKSRARKRVWVWQSGSSRRRRSCKIREWIKFSASYANNLKNWWLPKPKPKRKAKRGEKVSIEIRKQRKWAKKLKINRKKRA